MTFRLPLSEVPVCEVKVDKGQCRSFALALSEGGLCVNAAPALDLGYLLDVMHHKRPLDWQAVLKSDVPLKVVASCLDTLQPVILEDFTSAEVRNLSPVG